MTAGPGEDQEPDVGRRQDSWTVSEGRLQALISERAAPGADKERIDARIWALFGETWAIMFTDLAGFSRRVERFGIVHFLQTIYQSERLLLPVIEDHGGLLLKSEGDSMLVIFRDPGAAMRCAQAMQAALVHFNRDQPPEEDVLLCIGMGFGRVLKIGDADVYGAEVNAASKLGEDTARAGEILVTEGFRAALTALTPAQELGLAFERLELAPPGASAAFRVHAGVA
jgi:class 3 adenylate cyclase